jgi:CBS domain containing-hemolysin-like protein
MNSLTAALICLVLALGGVVVRKTYFALPLRELKRRAARHERPYVQLYRAAVYGSTLRSLLWLYIGLTSAAALVLLTRSLPVWASLLIVGPLLWTMFSLLPATRTTRAGTLLTSLVTPPLTWLLNYLHPLLSRGAEPVQRRYGHPHTGIFERDDLLELLERQQGQADNRLTEEELTIITRVLKFNGRTVGDVMTPRDQVRSVLADDTIGPILIDELHQSGQAFALVRASRKGDFVGTLAFQRLNLDSRGKVGDTMDESIYYLNETDSLGQALHAFFTTNQPLFVVVNSAEEYVGVLTIANVLTELLGHVPGEDFDQYADPAAVAARHTVKTDDEVVE